MGDWGLGIGDWGLGIGDWPNPQSPIPNPQSPYKKRILNIFYKTNKYTLFLLYINYYKTQY